MTRVSLCASAEVKAIDLVIFILGEQEMVCMTRKSGVDRAMKKCSKRQANLGPTAWVNIPTVGLKPPQPVEEESNSLCESKKHNLYPCRSHNLIVV